jgi:hypothetical protein
VTGGIRSFIISITPTCWALIYCPILPSEIEKAGEGKNAGHERIQGDKTDSLS